MKKIVQWRDAPFFHAKYFIVSGVLGLLIIVGTLFVIPALRFHQSPQMPTFIASIDTMKESRDTETRPLSLAEITNIVNLSARLNTNYITVDTHWDYPAYMQEWISAVRATGQHVWFRSHPNQWEDDNGTTGVMTPDQYKTAEQNFILAHPSFFQAGDIFDPCPEPESGRYWTATYGSEWTSNAPNAATGAYNAFLRDTTDVADAALHQKGIYGVITTVHSTNSYFPTHPGLLEAATVSKFGYITVDSYPEQSTTDPVTAARARVDELEKIENLWHVPIIIGEMGYSNAVKVGDAEQKAVLKAEFDVLAPLSYLVGANYWVGAGSDTSGGYTNLLVKLQGQWSFRQAAYVLCTFYQTRLHRNKPASS